MAIWLQQDARIVVQGISGKQGQFHTAQMIAYGSPVVAGVVPGKGGQKTEQGVAMFDTMEAAVAATAANVSVIFVPAAYAPDAILEAAAVELPLVVCITEGIPTLDMVRVKHALRGRRTRLIGPNTPGIITPGVAKVGIMPGFIHKPGGVGVISRSGTLTYEAVQQLTDLGLGQSTCLGVGGDPIIGTSFVDALAAFEQDQATIGVVLIGEIGGQDEQLAATFVREHMSKPVVAFIAGQTAPPGRRMGHAGAIIAGGKGTAAEKIAAFEAAGVAVARSPADIGRTMAKALGQRA